MNGHFKLNIPLPQEAHVPRMPTFSSTTPACSPGIFAQNFPRSNIMELLWHNAMYFIVSKCRNNVEGSVRLSVQITAFCNIYEGTTTAREQSVPGSRDRRNGKSSNLCRILNTWCWNVGHSQQLSDNEDGGFFVTNRFLGEYGWA
jgi:hypothetical protein